MNATTDNDIVTIPRADAMQVYTTPGAIEPYLETIHSYPVYTYSPPRVANNDD